MILSNVHIVSDLRDLWSVKSFRARVFFTIVPTIMAVAFGALAADRVHPYDYLPGSYIEPTSGKGGDQVTVHWKVKRNRDVCPGVVERVLIDPATDVVLAFYDPVLVYSGGPVNGQLVTTFAMPRNMQSGVVGYRAKLTFTCNWLQQLFPIFAIRYDTPILLFTVEP